MSSLFETVKVELKKVFKTKKNWWTKTEWRNIDNTIQEKTKRAIGAIQKNIGSLNFKEETTSTKSWELRRKTNISEKRLKAIGERKYLEEALERALVTSNENLFNQFNLLSGVMGKNQTRKSIDIVIAKNGKVNEMIELKAWSNKADSPILAAFELLFDYFIYTKILAEKIHKKKDIYPPEVEENLKLTVLAPKTYFDYYYNPNQKIIIKRIEDTINSELKSINFSFQCLPPNQDEHIKLIQNEKSSRNEIKKWFNEKTPYRLTLE